MQNQMEAAAAAALPASQSEIADTASEYEAALDAIAELLRQRHAIVIIPEKLRAAREKSGLTQADAARELGILPQHLNQIEAGRQRVPAATLLSMMKLYNEPDVFAFANIPSPFAAQPEPAVPEQTAKKARKRKNLPKASTNC